MEVAIREGMAYSEVSDSGRNYGGGNSFQPPDGLSNSDNGELRKRLGSMERDLNVDSPNQVPSACFPIKAAACEMSEEVVVACIWWMSEWMCTNFYSLAQQLAT